MNKKLVIVLMTAGLAQSAMAAEVYNKDANKLDFYGKAVARHYISDNTAVDGDATYIRLGFKGQTQISDVLTGFGQWEYNFQANHSEGGNDAQNGNKTRLGFAGLKHATLGSIDYGRNYGIIYDVGAITDTPVIFDDETYISADNFMTGRGGGRLTWRNNDFFGLVDGLNVAAQYQGANSNSTNNPRSATRANGNGYGFSLSYDTPWDVSILGAWATSKRTTAQNALLLGDGDRADIWATGLKYDHDSVYLAATWAQSQNMTPIGSLGYANKTDNLEVVAKYLFQNGFAPEVGYFKSKAKDLELTGDQDIMHYWDFSLVYYFNKNMSVYADYKLNRINKDNNLGIASDDQTGLGLTYQF